MESWRMVWRIAVELRAEDGDYRIPTAGLEALADALARDAPEVFQGATVMPPPVQGVDDWPVERACAWAYAGWKGLGLDTVAALEEWWAGLCWELDQRLGEPAACRWFLNWFDETPREQMRRQLLGEVERAIVARLTLEAAAKA